MAVEVRKLPDRRLVPQNGRVLIIDGMWRYEAITFDGEGVYAITVVATLASQSERREIVVKCRNKLELYRELIESDRLRRYTDSSAAPPREAVSLEDPQRPDSVSREEAYWRISQIQDRCLEKYKSGDLEEALEAIFESFDILDTALVLFPDDPTFQASRAFFMKYYAMIKRARNQPDEFRRALAEAETIFKAIRDKEPHDANAWNGLGSVALLRDKPELALYYIDRSLEIDPENSYAREYREAAIKLLKDPGT